MRSLIPYISIVLLAGCGPSAAEHEKTRQKERARDRIIHDPSLVVLGTIQDAGSPHPGCTKKCCADLFLHPDADRMVVCLGLIDPDDDKIFMLEATPDFTRQLQVLNSFQAVNANRPPDGILLTHAHIGHYTGLMYLGREALNAGNVNVYAMPRMRKFLSENGPWNQLVKLNNIQFTDMDSTTFKISRNFSVTPVTVPHRDEYSETVGFIIEGASRKVLFIPDIDKWEKWTRDIRKLIQSVDLAFLDATFYDADEIPGRNMDEIPHPFITESMEVLKILPTAEKSKIHFIHFNHTNPVLDKKSEARKKIQAEGYNISAFKDVFPL